MTIDTSRDRRAQMVALCGFALQTVMFLVMFLVSHVWDADALRAEALHLHLGIYLWLALFLLYSQRKRAGVEQLETEELKRSRESAGDLGLFQAEDENLLVQRRRLNWMYRWFLPVTGMLLALVHILWSVAWFLGDALPVRDARWRLCDSPQRALPFVVGVTFLCFLYSRYAVGMAKRPEWRMLRAPATYLAGNALLGLVLVVALALSIYQIPLAEPVAAYVIRIAILVLGLEFLVNFVLDFYRPRVAGQEARPAFDSRLLGLISEPGGIARSIQEAINYQFGFEVSATWFYQLLKRSLLPLAVFALLIMVGLSSLVIVDADEQAFTVHLGRLVQPPDQPLGPGLHFRYPWPIDKVERERVRQLRSMSVGEAKDEDHGDDGHHEAILWTKEHEYVPEMMLLVASPQLTDLSASPGAGEPAGAEDRSALSPGSVRGKAVAVSLIMASVSLEYRITDLFNYKNSYVNPEKVIEVEAHRALANYAAGIDVHHIMGPGRDEFNRKLRGVLQKRFDDLQLGVELTFVGLQDAHPPAKDEVAQKFQDVVAAKSRKEAAIQTARGKADQTLTEVAGSRQRALTLDDVIVAMDRLSSNPSADPQRLAEAKSRVEELLLGSSQKGIAPISGRASAVIAEARAQVSRSLSDAESKNRTFQNELAAFRAAPELYQVRRTLEVLSTGMNNIRKYVNATQNGELIVTIDVDKKPEFDLPAPEPGRN